MSPQKMFISRNFERIKRFLIEEFCIKMMFIKFINIIYLRTKVLLHLQIKRQNGQFYQSKMMNSRRALLQIQSMKEVEQSQQNIIFSEKTQASEDQQYHVLSVGNGLQNTLPTFTSSLWLFIVNKSLPQSFTESIQRIFLCGKNYKQLKMKMILPLFKFTYQGKNFIKKLSDSKEWKFKIVVDSYNLADAVEEWKNNPNVVEMYVFNDLKEDGLDQILPIKKKTQKIIGVFNSIGSLVIKAQKQMDFRVGFLQKQKAIEDQSTQIIPVYPNQVAQHFLMPYSVPAESQVNRIIQCICLPVQQKKNLLQSFFSYLRSQFFHSEIHLQQIQKLQTLNHISPIVTEQRALQMVKIYFGLDLQHQDQVDQDKSNKRSLESLLDFIIKKIDQKKEIKQLQVGIHEVFHSITYLAKSFSTLNKISQTNSPLSILNSQQQVQAELFPQASQEKQPEFYYKIIIIPIQNLRDILGKTIQIHQFTEFYSDIQTAQRQFQSELNFDPKQSFNFFEEIRNKLCLKIPAKRYQPDQQNFTVNFGMIDLQKTCKKLKLSTPKRWKNICITNILATFKIDKMQKNESFMTIILNPNYMSGIFESDPHYLSLEDSKILNFYKRTNIFKALNGQYRQVRKKMAHRQNKSNGKINNMKQTQKTLIRPTKDRSYQYAMNILQLSQSLSSPNQNSNIYSSLFNLGPYTQHLNSSYSQASQLDQLAKKKFLRLKQKLGDQELDNKHNQKLFLLLEDWYGSEEELYELKYEMEDWHICGQHIQNLETILIKYNAIIKDDTTLKTKELKLRVRKADLAFRKGKLSFAYDNLSQVLSPVEKLIQQEQLQNVSCCSFRYIAYLCSCKQKNLNLSLFSQFNSLLQRMKPQDLDCILDFLNVITDTIALRKKMIQFLGNFDDFSTSNRNASIQQYYEQRIKCSINRVKDSAKLIRLKRVLGMLSTSIQDENRLYLDSIRLIQQQEPFSFMCGQYYTQLADHYFQRIINQPVELYPASLLPENILSDLNTCLEFYEQAIMVYECQKHCEVSIIRNLSKIVEILVKFNHLQLVRQIMVENRVKVLVEDVMTDNRIIGRSEVGELCYRLSLYYQKIGETQKSIQMMKRALKQLQGSNIKQSIIPYQVIHKLCPSFFSYKLRYITLSLKNLENNILSQSQIKDLLWLEQAFSKHYFERNESKTNNSTSQILPTSCLLILKQLAYAKAQCWKYKKQTKNYFEYLIRTVRLAESIHQKQRTQTRRQFGNNTEEIIQLYCELIQVMIGKNNALVQLFFKKISFMHFISHYDRKNFKYEQKKSIEPSFVEDQLDNSKGIIFNEQNGRKSNGSDNKKSVQQVLQQYRYWKYDFCLGQYNYHKKSYNQALNSLISCIHTLKSSYINNFVVAYSKSNSKIKSFKISGSFQNNSSLISKDPQIQPKQFIEFGIDVYQAQLRYIIYVLQILRKGNDKQVILGKKYVDIAKEMSRQIIQALIRKNEIGKEMEKNDDRKQIENINLSTPKSGDRLNQISLELITLLQSEQLNRVTSLDNLLSSSSLSSTFDQKFNKFYKLFPLNQQQTVEEAHKQLHHNYLTLFNKKLQTFTIQKVQQQINNQIQEICKRQGIQEETQQDWLGFKAFLSN